jgi:hypothetical protein
LVGADYNWRKDAGFGVVDPQASIQDAATINHRTDRTKQ